MRIFSILLIVLFSSISLAAQDITGQWNGELKVQGIQLRVVFNVTSDNGELKSTMDSPDQGVKGIPTTATTFENTTLKITIINAGIEYVGTLGDDNIIVGTFKQAGHSFPMNLSKEEIEKEVIARPQEPVKPYPYYSEDITFENKEAEITLAGTLTLPNENGVFPVVILISGSGPQNRDEELLGHKPFLVLSDFLTRNGIAVLRYDDRGTAQSKGDFKTATSADFATDVESAIEYLKSRNEINKKQIGLIGHSEGGIIAPMVANKSKDVAFIILLAGTGLQGDQILLSQQKLIGKASGISDEALQENELINRKAFDVVKESNSLEQLNIDLTNLLNQFLVDNPTTEIPQGVSSEDFVKLQVAQVTNPWMRYFIKYDPSPALEKVKCPVLALGGEKDLQVPSKENLEAIKKALSKGGNKKITIKELPNLNHLFQESNTGTPNEYATIEQTLSPIALNEILKWIQSQTN
ncbi:MAG: alpha/beta hydrolase [Fermentimonas sp.]|nr:alpha/beta hydrolase [Fermentimonas sp.]